MMQTSISTVTAGILKGMEEAVRDAQGLPVQGIKRSAVYHVKPKEIRQQLKMSQQEFSAAFGIPLATLRNWEQGRRQIDGTATSYLRAIMKFPDEMRAAQEV